MRPKKGFRARMVIMTNIMIGVCFSIEINGLSAFLGPLPVWNADSKQFSYTVHGQEVIRE